MHLGQRADNAIQTIILTLIKASDFRLCNYLKEPKTQISTLSSALSRMDCNEQVCIWGTEVMPHFNALQCIAAIVGQKTGNIDLSAFPAPELKNMSSDSG